MIQSIEMSALRNIQIMRGRVTFLILLILSFATLVDAQTSWKGITNTDWQTTSNWTNGVPTAGVDAIIGDANFTGAYQPALSKKAFCKSLTIGTSTKTSALTVPKNITVMGNITIGNNGSIVHDGKITIKLNGNWSNSGVYTTNNAKCSVVFSGGTQNITGTTTFRCLTINTGSTLTLLNNITVNNNLIVNGTFDPTETCSVSGTGDLSVNAGGTIVVKAANYSTNYNLSGSTTLNSSSTVNYASSTINQNVTNTLTYGYLRISGGLTKSLVGNLPALNSHPASSGRINVDAGTLDLLTYTANRGTPAGGAITVAAGAKLKIGGTNSFPSNYSTASLATTSTVEYAGTAQTVTALSYGNLTLSSSSGSVVKTMPSTALVIAGHLTGDIGAGTAVSFTAGNTITVNRDVILGSGCTFNGGSYAHTFKGNWTNAGTYTGSTSTATFSGINAVISGSGTNNFYNLVFSGSGITAPGSTTINVTGNLSTSGSGIFTHSTSGNLTMSGTSKTITGNGLNLYNLTISGTTTTTANITISGNFTANNTFAASSGTVTFNGTSKTISGSSSITFYALNIFGTITTGSDFSMLSNLSVASSGSFTASAGTATFIGTTSLSGTANLFNVTINSAKTLTLGSNSILGIANTFTKTGTLTVTTTTPNTVQYNSAGAQNVVATTYYNLILDNGNTKTALGAITINDDLTINAGVTFNASTFTHSLYRHFTNNGTFTASSSTFQLLGNNAANITGTTTFNNLIENKINSTVLVTLLNNVTTLNLSMTSGKMNTGSNSVTITGTRTGNGIIIGTITHSHAFVNATAYYFEGPQNAITFTSPNAALNSVTVTVTIGEIMDFIPGNDCVTREYDISIPAGTYTNATLKLHYEDNELNAFIEPYLSQYHFVSGTNWDSVGITTRSTTLNFVERTSITTGIAGRWALSGLRSVVRWNGSVSSVWENASNWTTISGADMSNRIPGSTDAAQIGYATFTYNPIINSNPTVNILNFGSAKASTVTINSGKTLTTVGSIKGEWSSSKSHVLDVSSGALNIGTNLTLSDGTSGHDIELRIGTGSAIINSDLKQCASGSVNFTGSGILTISGDYNYSAGSFTPNTGTVIYTGGISQVVAPVSYYNLSFTKSTEQAIINYPTTINGNLLLSTGGSLLITDAITVEGNITIGANTSIIHPTINPINLKGNWNNSGTLDMDNGAVCFNGTGTQNVSATTFNSIEVNKPSGTLNLTGDLAINSDLTLTAGTLDLSNYLANRSNPGGTLFIGPSAILKIAGSNNFPDNFNTNSIDVSSTIEYSGTIAQTIGSATYGNLTFSNGGSTPKSLISDIQVNGDLLINSGATLDPGSNAITLYGNFTNNGTYTPSGSTLLLSGSSKTFAGTTTLNNLTVLGSYMTTSASISMTGNLYVDVSGSLNLQTTSAFLDGDLTNKGSLISNGIATFTGTKLQTIQLQTSVTSTSTGQIVFAGTVAPVLNSSSNPQFATVKIYNTGGVTASVPWTVAIACVIGPGATFDGGALTHTFLGHFYNYGTVISSGTLNFSPIYFPSTIMLDNGTSFISSGKVIFAGTQPITIVGNTSAFNDVSITNINAVGVTPQKSWAIAGNVYIGPGATFKAGTGFSHTFRGNLTDNGILNGETSTIRFIGNPSGIDGVGATTFNNLIIDSTFYLNKSINVSGNFTTNTIDFAPSGYGVTFSGSTPSIINSTIGAITFDYIEQDKTNPNNTTLSVPVFVTNDLVLSNGIIKTTATNILTLNDNANASTGTATSFVDGPMKKIGDDAFVFPVGNNSVWARIGISAPASTSAEFQAQYNAVAYSDITNVLSPINNVSQNEYWILNRTVGSDNVNVTLYWESGARSGISDLADIVVARYNGSKWEDKTQNGGVTGTSNAGSVTSQAITAFSPFTFGSKSGKNTLPVELLSFEAACNNNNVDLAWSTASEINNDYFTIEKSSNAQNWNVVATIQGSGNTNTITNYSYTDNANDGNSTYYRLKQTDYNGEFKYYDSIAVKCGDVFRQINLYPNPASNQTICSIYSDNQSQARLEITNYMGTIVFSENYDLQNGFNALTIDVSEFQSGVYYVVVRSSNENIIGYKRLVINN
jgi:fibronectin-binding autotransporter adhesin